MSADWLIRAPSALNGFVACSCYLGATVRCTSDPLACIDPRSPTCPLVVSSCCCCCLCVLPHAAYLMQYAPPLGLAIMKQIGPKRARAISSGESGYNLGAFMKAGGSSSS